MSFIQMMLLCLAQISRIATQENPYASYGNSVDQLLYLKAARPLEHLGLMQDSDNILRRSDSRPIMQLPSTTSKLSPLSKSAHLFELQQFSSAMPLVAPSMMSTSTLYSALSAIPITAPTPTQFPAPSQIVLGVQSLEENLNSSRSSPSAMSSNAKYDPTSTPTLSPTIIFSATPSIQRTATPSPTPSALTSAVPSSLPTSISTVTIDVQLLTDGKADIGQCNTSPTGLSSCNLRSAWALCLHLISKLSSSCSDSPPAFWIVLPSGSTSILKQEHGGNLTLANLDVPCNITLSVMSSSQSSQATISGDGSGAGLLFVSSLHSRVISLHLVRLLITNFRSVGGNKNHIPCVHLNNLNRVVFDHVTLLSSAVGYLVFFLIDGSNSIVLSNLLAKNNTASVIAISTVGSVAITGCAFRGNNVQTSYGAVVSIVQVQDLVIADTVVSDNTADSGFVFYLKDAVIAVSRCKFTGNTLYFCGPLYSSSATSLTVSDSTFESNRALSSISVGGAVTVDSTESGTVSFTGCSFVNNTAQYFGGAIHVTYALLSISKCSFDSNRANLGGAVACQGFAVIEDSSFNLNSATPVISNPLRYVPRGGAVFLINGTDCRVTRCNFTNNKAHTYGGAISAVALKRLYVVNCSLTDNYSGVYGGGISIEGGNSGSGYTIQRTDLTRNVAQMHGGGIYFSPLNYYISTVSCAFLNNRAIEGSGGAMYFEKTCNKISIGGLNPKTLSIATARLYVIEDDSYSLLNYYGTLKIPRASGYYVIFDAKTVLLGNRYSNGIEITGVDGLAYQGRKFWEYEHKIEPVTEINDDIAAWPGIGGNSPLFVNGNILEYKLHELTDHYIFTAYPILKNEPPNTFTGNTAALSGGAIYWGTANSEIFMMPGTQFTGNSVTGVEGSGGALFMHISNSLIYIFSSTFIKNTAYTGGAITLSQSNYPMSLYQCTFTQNSATKYGGAIYLGDGNGYGFFRMLTSTAIRFFDAVFNANTAGYSGGGAYISNSNALTFNNTVMSDNLANYSGGALHFEFKNIAAMNYSLLSHNTAYRGGAIQSSTGNSIAFDKLTSFINNKAGYQGGALYAIEGSAVSFLGETSFSRNHANSGGAIFSSGSTTTLGVKSIVFEGNFAYLGSALIFEFLQSGQLIILPSNTTSITFLRNNCPGSSTVYWTKEPTASAAIYDKNHISNFQRIVYLNNSAKFGNESSTQAIKLMFTDKNVSYTGAYNAEMLSHLNLSLFDYFNQTDITDYHTIVTVTVASYSCMNKVGYLSGITTATVIGGATQLTQVSAFCFPGGNMTLDYTAAIKVPGEEQYTAYYIVMQATFVFRQCVDGEILVDNQCLVCPSGSYSLLYNPLNRCTDCPPFTDGCYGSTILVSPGYWRIDNRSVVMLECPFGNTACRGGRIRSELPTHARALGGAPLKFVSTYVSSSTLTTADNTGYNPEGCVHGYEGPLCAVCSKGFYFSSTTSTCLTCEDHGRGQLAIMILVPLTLLVLVVFFTFTTFLAKPRDESSHVAMSWAVFFSLHRNKTTITPEVTADPWQKKDKRVFGRGKSIIVFIKEWMFERLPIMLPKVKIMLTVYQIISSFPLALQIKFGSNSTSVFRSFSFVNFSALSIGSPQCYYKYDYVDKLIFETSTPIIVVAFMGIAFGFHMRASRNDDSKLQSPLITRYLTLFFLLTYLVLPSATTTIFGAFTCRSIDPGNVLPGTPHFLRNDLSISCSSSRYRLGFRIAVAMIFVYPIGITSMYAYVLYMNREDIMKQKNHINVTPSSPSCQIVATGVQEPYSSPSAVSPRSDRVGLMQYVSYKEIDFLHKAYEGRCWYWEIVETVRRLLLTAVLSVVTVGSSGQIVCGILISVVSIKLYGFFCPFKNNDDDVLQEMAQFQVFFTLFISLLIRDQSFTAGNWRKILDVLLVVVNLFTTALFLYSFVTGRNYYFFQVTVKKSDVAGGDADASKGESSPVKDLKVDETSDIEAHRIERDSDDDDDDDEQKSDGTINRDYIPNPRIE